MADKEKLTDTIRLSAEQQGPEAVQAAAERGLRPLGAAPAGTSPIASPAPVFDPTRFEDET
jgi:hypothetical protein